MMIQLERDKVACVNKISVEILNYGDEIVLECEVFIQFYYIIKIHNLI